MIYYNKLLKLALIFELELPEVDINCDNISEPEGYDDIIYCGDDREPTPEDEPDQIIN